MRRSFGACVGIALAASAHAATLSASFDQSRLVLNIGAPSLLTTTLRNGGPAALYITGADITLSDGAHGILYDPALLQDKLHKLAPGETWDGPLIAVTPHRRGPLLIKGSIRLLGGDTPGSKDVLAILPIELTINDARRELDGSYAEETTPTCDRSGTGCCDPGDPDCFTAGKRCLYVAAGHAKEMFCTDGTPDPPFTRLTDVRVSADGAHTAYIGIQKCSSNGADELCERVIVVDHREHPAREVPTHLQLSPDGAHYAYLGRKACIRHDGEDQCAGPSHPFVDGARVDALPAWAL